MASVPQDPIRFIATLPDSSVAIKIDGREGEGGRVMFDVPGDDIAPLIRLVTLRGKRLHVAVSEAK